MRRILAVAVVVAAGCHLLIGLDAGGPFPSGAGGSGASAASTQSATAIATAAGTGGAGGAGGGAVADCWSRPPFGPTAGWSVQPLDVSQLPGASASDYMMSKDGLRLFYDARATMSAPPRIYKATRAGRSEPFSGGTLLDAWAQYSGADPYRPWAADDESEIFLDLDDGKGNIQLGYTLKSAASYTVPAPLFGNVEPGDNSVGPALAAAGQRLIFWKNTGGPTAVGKAYQLYESIRKGVDFSAPTPLSIPGIEPTDLAFCPAPADDGLHLFFASTHGFEVQDTMYATHAGRVFYSERPSLDGAWTAAAPVDAFNSDTWDVCPQAITADGCQLLLQHFSFLPNVPATEYLATRTPGP